MSGVANGYGRNWFPRPDAVAEEPTQGSEHAVSGLLPNSELVKECPIVGRDVTPFIDEPSGRGDLTDRSLAHFAASDLMTQLLTQVQNRLRVDTVAILLLDRDGSHLVARAARGLEDEVHQGVRLPVGRGFAGRIAATRAPVALLEVGPTTVVNPILWRKGIRSMLGVPLVANGRLLGVMHIGTLTPRGFTDGETAALDAAASQIAIALSAQQTVAERSAARTLQESLLPTQLPDVDGLEFATRFVAAEDFGVGGDWFDAF